MRAVLEKYKKCLGDKKFVCSLLLGIFLLVAAIIINFYAARYATVQASSSVTDIILSNTKVYDVDGFFVYGSIVLVLFIVLICLWEPTKMPFTAKSIALFVLTRSAFITLTHIGPFPTHVLIDGATWHYVAKILGPNLFMAFFSGNDLFFSGHTGLPFLMALIYWEQRPLRLLFLMLSLAFGATVLLAHLHYSIDVLAAFFITATIFDMAKYIFKKDFEAARRQESIAESNASVQYN